MPARRITPKSDHFDILTFNVGGTPAVYHEDGSLKSPETHTATVELHNPTEEEVNPIRETLFEELESVGDVDINDIPESERADLEGEPGDILELGIRLKEKEREHIRARNEVEKLLFKDYAPHMVRSIKMEFTIDQQLKFTDLVSEILDTRLYFLSRGQ